MCMDGAALAASITCCRQTLSHSYRCLSHGSVCACKYQPVGIQHPITLSAPETRDELHEGDQCWSAPHHVLQRPGVSEVAVGEVCGPVVAGLEHA